MSGLIQTHDQNIDGVDHFHQTPWFYYSESVVTMVFFGILTTIYIITFLLQIPRLNFV